MARKKASRKGPHAKKKGKRRAAAPSPTQGTTEPPNAGGIVPDSGKGPHS